jgi:CDP-diacylglycerol pyrophosphatase
VINSIFGKRGNLSNIIFIFRFEGHDGKNEKESCTKEKLTGGKLLVATIRQMKEPRQLLLIPLTMWSGIEQGFFGSDFTAVC